MIPKILHYCWFGRGGLPKEQALFLAKWSVIMPSYKIMRWDDSNVGEFLDNSEFVKDAIQDKKYAFLSDYIRLAVLHKFGGIYFDTDVNALKKFDRFLNDSLFVGFILDCSIGTAVIGSEPNNSELLKWISYMETFYGKNHCFVPNNQWLTLFFMSNYHDFKLNGQRQNLLAGISIYPKEFFESSKPFFIHDGGFSQHFCAGSWITNKSNALVKHKFLARICPLFIKKWRNWQSHNSQLSSSIFYKEYLLQSKNDKKYKTPRCT